MKKKVLSCLLALCLCQLHYLQDREAHLPDSKSSDDNKKTEEKADTTTKHYLQQITTSSQIITLTHSTQTP